MKLRGAITAFLLLVPAASFAANKDMETLQRDVALMQEDIRQLQRAFDQKVAALTTLTQQTVDNTNRISTSVGVVQQTLPGEVKREVSAALGPIAGLNTRLDQVSNQVQTLADAVQALNASMQQLRTQLTDLKTTVAAIQVAPPPPPPSDPTNPNAAASTAPQVPLETLYDNAMRDKSGGKPDLAVSEFANCVKWYHDAPQAPSCQFYIGEIHYSTHDYEQAVKDFDAVLEQFPKGNRTPEAYFFKGMALVKMSNSRDARKEFLAVIKDYPKSDAAERAREAMRGLGFNTPAAKKK
jgi:TolA-binding protein